MTFIAAPTDSYNSFASVADADTFHTDRANAAWASLTTGAKQAALIKATDYILANYSFNIDPVGTATVEPMLTTATAMLALISITTDLFPVQDSAITTSDEKTLAGVGTLKTTYAQGRADRFPTITNFLANLATYAPVTTASRLTVGLIVK